ncbi:unnamed protein product [Sphagnum jensenii]|uniref:Uncharacterized protein n=1 Tax=Sphagnum jensenii TaxID=128206 RepID=A0ABP1AN21_9BRYO
MDVDASKRVAIVTGANTGIGRETALGLAKAGMKVFLACRNADKAREAATYIRQSCSHIPGGQADVDILVLDLQSLQSVRKCATDFKSRNLPLHLLVNNAGVNPIHIPGPPWYTAEGVGVSAQINYLGPYVLTRLLEKNLVAAAPSRVVNVSSIRHRQGKMQDPVYHDVLREKFLRDFEAASYTEAKLANILFTFELQRRWQGTLHDLQTRVVAPTLSEFVLVCAVALDWQIRNLSSYWGRRGRRRDSTNRSGSSRFLSNCKEVPANPIAYDANLASKLWTLSAEIAGLPA